jgi:hypothetical protein
LRSLALRGGLPRNSRKSVSAAYRMYWRLQHARSCWFLHCANVGTAKKLAQKKHRRDEILMFMRASPRDETHLCCKQGQNWECPSGSERVLHRLLLRSNHPAVGEQTDGIAAPQVAQVIGFKSARVRIPHLRSTSAFDVPNALLINPAPKKLLRISPRMPSPAFARHGLQTHKGPLPPRTNPP